MDKLEYETSKRYLVSGIEVHSEIVSDQETPEYRAFHISSSCASQRWGKRTLGFSLTCYKNTATDIMNTLESARFKEVERIIKIESGELPEGGPVFLGVQIQGPTGKAINALALPDLSLSASLLGQEIIDFLELSPLQRSSFQEQAVSLPLFKIVISSGTTRVETMVAASAHGSPACILGGDFFQKALRGKEYIVTELVMPDDRRALANAARCKKRNVLIAGKYGEHRFRLERIKQALSTLNFIGLILDEYPDIEEQPLAEKMVTYASICRFVIVDDFVPSGHIDELAICRERKFVTAILRPGGKASTAMQAEIADEGQFMEEFSYVLDAEFEARVLDAARWADETVCERARRLNRRYSGWRAPDKIVRS